MFSEELQKNIIAPGITEDDAFNSNVLGNNRISYRLPSPHKLLGVPEAILDEYESMTFTLKI